MTRRFAYLLAALVVALSAIGIGYAAWNQNLSINGTINTGSLSACIILDTPPFASSSEYATIAEGDSSDTNLVINISNAFPGNIFSVNYIVVNMGTMPADVAIGEPDITANGTDAAADDITIVVPAGSEPTLPGTSASGSISITINDSIPNTGTASYSVNIPIIVSPS